MCFFLFNRTRLQVFVTYFTDALYVHPLWFHKHQHDSWVRSNLFVACQRWWFQWRFWFVTSDPGYLREEVEHKPPDPSVQLHIPISSCIVYDKLLKPRQSFWITLYIVSYFNILYAHVVRYSTLFCNLSFQLKLCDTFQSSYSLYLSLIFQSLIYMNMSETISRCKFLNQG